MLYWEDFSVGQVFEGGPRPVTKEEIVAFATRFDPQPFHIDEDAAKRGIYGGLIASGWHTIGMAMRMLVDTVMNRYATIPAPGVDETRWKKPVRPGDTLFLRVEILALIPSRSKADRGVVRSRVTLTNQKDEEVLTLTPVNLYRRRPAANA